MYIFHLFPSYFKLSLISRRFMAVYRLKMANYATFTRINLKLCDIFALKFVDTI